MPLPPHTAHSAQHIACTVRFGQLPTVQTERRLCVLHAGSWRETKPIRVHSIFGGHTQHIHNTIPAVHPLQTKPGRHMWEQQQQRRLQCLAASACPAAVAAVPAAAAHFPKHKIFYYYWSQLRRKTESVENGTIPARSNTHAEHTQQTEARLPYHHHWYALRYI